MGRRHKKSRFVCPLLVHQAPFQVHVAIHIMTLLPTLLWLCGMFIERLDRRAEYICEFLRYNVVLRFAIV